MVGWKCILMDLAHKWYGLVWMIEVMVYFGLDLTFTYICFGLVWIWFGSQPTVRCL